jgi:hypothetical protein
MRMAALPPWPARNEADNLRMLRWLEDELRQLDHKEMYAAYHLPKIVDARERMDFAVDYAERGDIGLLREELAKLAGDPRVARFVNLPTLARGERWRTDGRARSLIACAAEDVDRIRALWRQHYKKKKRRSTDGWSADVFAAKIWEIGEDSITRRRKKTERIR